MHSVKRLYVVAAGEPAITHAVDGRVRYDLPLSIHTHAVMFRCDKNEISESYRKYLFKDLLSQIYYLVKYTT